MRDLEAWLHRQATREQRIVTLEQGLLGDRLWRYSAYRLRFFFAGYLVESAAHAVAVLYLFRDLGWHSFVGVVIAQTGTALASALWWGALEAMRAQVRDLHRSGRPHRIAATVGGWLTLSLALAALVVALAVGWLAGFAARRGARPVRGPRRARRGRGVRRRAPGALRDRHPRAHLPLRRLRPAAHLQAAPR